MPGEAEPKTGRTHQIRVHFSENGYPILADKIYGHKKQRNRILAQAANLINRHALHASKIGFNHPEQEKWVEFEAPLPDDMMKTIEFLEKTNTEGM